MTYLFRAFTILGINFLLLGTAYPQHKIGGWDLVKILSVNSHKDYKPLLRKGIRLELISERLTFWTESVSRKNYNDENIYCHPEKMDWVDLSKGDYSKDVRLKPFLKKVGGLSGLDKILRRNFNFSLKQFDFAYVTGPNKDGKEPCKSIENKNIYMAKDKKSVYIFSYPYIYQFKGVFDYIDGSSYDFEK